MTLKVTLRYVTTILLQRNSHQNSDKLANNAPPKMTQCPQCHSDLLSGVVGPTIPLLSTLSGIQMHRLESMIVTEKYPINDSNLCNIMIALY